VTTLRMLAHCLDRSGTVSIVHDVLCYHTGLPEHTNTSLLDHIRALRGKHIHLDVIFVGVEQFNIVAKRKVDSAVFKLRETYAQVDLGVARVEYFQMTESEAGDYAVIDSKLEAFELTSRFSGPNDDALDAFVVANYDLDDEHAGIAAINVACDKDRAKMTGAVFGKDFTGVPLDPVMLGQVMAHEVGHLLGLRHVTNVGNLMFPTASGFELAPSQGAIMRSHCMVHAGCDL
jgi:Metallo-peptidase family M12B Reprolysin-like